MVDRAKVEEIVRKGFAGFSHWTEGEEAALATWTPGIVDSLMDLLARTPAAVALDEAIRRWMLSSETGDEDAQDALMWACDARGRELAEAAAKGEGET